MRHGAVGTDSVSETCRGKGQKVMNKGIGRNKQYKFLRDKKILMHNNIPYQTYVERGSSRWLRVATWRPTATWSLRPHTAEEGSNE